MQQVVAPQNLGNEFDIGAIEANKIHLKLVPTELSRNAAGQIGINPAAVAAAETLTTIGLVATTINYMDEDGNVTAINLTPAVKLAETTTVLVYDPATTTLTFTDEDGGNTVVDLSALAADIYVSGAVFDAAALTLTLTDNSGTTPDVVVDLSAMISSVTNNGDGTYTHTSGNGTSTIIDTKDGVSVDAGNLLSLGADGKPFVDAGDVRALADVDVQDVFGNHLYWAFSINS